jgi:transposase
VNHAPLLALCGDELIALIVAQHVRIEAQAQQTSALTARIASLEAKLAAPPKTPDNPSLPPSLGRKANLSDHAKKPPRPGRPGVARERTEHPDKSTEATLTTCPHCDHTLGPTDQPEIHAYDHIDLLQILPVVARINRHSGICPCCRKHMAAPALEGFEPGSPLGPGLHALILHLHITQAISFERLARLMGEVFGLSISEGAIANILSRTQTPLLAAAAPMAAAVRARPVMGSDETSTRVCGKTWWQWVLLSSAAICHVIADTRAASVVTAFLQGAQSEVWMADRYGGQLGHGAVRQMRLAHLLRDAKYAIEDGDAVFAPGFRQLLLRAMAIGKRRDALKDTTLAQYHADLDRRLSRLPSGPAPTHKPARRLFRVARHTARPRRSVPRRHPPRCGLYQQRLRAGTAPVSDLPQIDQLLPRRVGCTSRRRGGERDG